MLEKISRHTSQFSIDMATDRRRINQLTGPRMTVEKLSEWLSIGVGTADLLIQYAEEDVVLIKNGLFSMKLENE